MAMAMMIKIKLLLCLFTLAPFVSHNHIAVSAEEVFSLSTKSFSPYSIVSVSFGWLLFFVVGWLLLGVGCWLISVQFLMFI